MIMICGQTHYDKIFKDEQDNACAQPCLIILQKNTSQQINIRMEDRSRLVHLFDKVIVKNWTCNCEILTYIVLIFDPRRLCMAKGPAEGRLRGEHPGGGPCTHRKDTSGYIYYENPRTPFAGPRPAARYARPSGWSAEGRA